MRLGGRLGSIALCLLMLFAQTGCYTQRRVPLDQESRYRKLRQPEGQAIAGYTTSSGRWVRHHGFAQVTPDSIVLTTPRERSWGFYGRPGTRQSLPRDSVVQLEVRVFSPVRTTFAVLGGSILVLGVVAAVAIASKESCPFLYSWNGREYVFDGEPYGGATMRSLERTDWSELEHLRAVDGRYRLMLTNEVDETQHTNLLELLVVDHARGTRLVMDPNGTPHAFASSSPLRSARDGHGVDLTRWLRDDDRMLWNSNLDRHAAADSLPDTREHLTLRFDRPPGVDTVFLVTRAGTGQWGSHMIRSMLGLRGDRVGEFYAAIDNVPAYRDQLLAWNLREELYELGVELHAGDDWRKVAMIPGGGPFVLESRAIPIPLHEVRGSSLELRIHPPIGFWSLNSFHLAWGETALNAWPLAARSATDAQGASVLDLVRSDDDLYLDFPTTNERAVLEFDAPPPMPGRSRTVFARTRGWYQIHLHRTGEPDLAAIERLTNEPGHAVRMALREFREFRRTGVLAGTAPAAGGR
jgi:hypothetical protein